MKAIGNVIGKYNLQEIELIRMCKELKYADGFAVEALQEKIKRFVGKDKNLKAIQAEIMENPKSIPQKYIEQINSYENDTCTIAALSGVSKFMEKGIENLSEKDRKDIVSLIIAGTLDKRSDLGKNEHVIEVLEQLCPDINLSDKDGKKDIRNLMSDNESLSNLKKYLPLDESREINSENIETIAKAFRLKTIKEFDSQKLHRIRNFFAKDMKKSNIGILRHIGKKLSDSMMNKFWDKNVEELDVNELIDEMGKSVEEKFFEGSRIRFTNSDKGYIKSLYENSTDACWISSKQQYLDLQISSLFRLENELESKVPLSKIDYERLIKTQERINDFYQLNEKYDFTKIIDDDYNIKPEIIDKLDSFEEYKVKSKLMSTYMKNSSIVSSPKDYEKLDNEAKKDYLKNTIVGLSYKKESEKDDRDEKLIGKFAERRLEIISSRKNKFISTRSWGNGYRAEVDYDKILEEYNKYSKHKFKSYEELEEFCNSNKRVYVVDKLDEYKKLSNEDFREAEGKTVHERVKFIEGLRYYFNKREEKTKNDKAKNKTNSKENNNKVELEESDYTTDENNSLKADEIKLSDAETEKEEHSELPVPVDEKQGFFKRLFNKVKGIFTRDDKLTEDVSDSEKEETKNQNSNSTVENNSNSFIEHIDVNPLEAVNKFKNGSNGAKEMIAQKDAGVSPDDSTR